jgi:hypothetical protein
MKAALTAAVLAALLGTVAMADDNGASGGNDRAADREHRHHRHQSEHDSQYPQGVTRPGDPNPYTPKVGAPNPYAPKVGAPDPYAPKVGAPNPYAPVVGAPNPYAPVVGAPNPYATRGGDPPRSLSDERPRPR